ncbi:MAG: DoxX family protein [Proteobacteria bacterium]|nr:DoxX family protein [Pseudomonadota bacterium]
MQSLSKPLRILDWILRLTAAVILAQTLWFKFTAAPESVYIFDKVGLGAPGRIGSGVAELIAALLLVIPRTAWLGAGLAIAVMGGAIMSHLTVLGIDVMGDHGELFGLAVTVALCSAIVLFLHRRDLPFIGKLLPF